MDIVERLRFDAARTELQFSKGVAGNIEEAANVIEQTRESLRRVSREASDEIERLRAALKEVLQMSDNVSSEDGGEELANLCKRALEQNAIGEK